jgi:hypothetical protein
MPWSRALSPTVMTVIDNNASRCGTSDSSRMSSTNSIEASPLGPNHPRKSCVWSPRPAPTSEMAIGTIRITVRLSTAYMTTVASACARPSGSRAAPNTRKVISIRS